MIDVKLCDKLYATQIGYNKPRLPGGFDAVHNFLYAKVQDDAMAELAPLQKQNFEMLLAKANAAGMKYLVINYCEIWGTENVKTGPWPAIWQVARDLGIHGGCGNTDQAQIKDARSYLPAHVFNKRWDTTLLTAEEGQQYRCKVIAPSTLAWNYWT
jgi:hypothetical protein